MGSFFPKPFRGTDELRRSQSCLCENGLYRSFFHAMLERGVALAPAYEYLRLVRAQRRRPRRCRQRGGEARRSPRNHECATTQCGWSVRPELRPPARHTRHVCSRKNALTSWRACQGGVAKRRERTVQYPIRALRARHGAVRDAAAFAYCWRNPSRNDFEALRAISSPRRRVAHHRRAPGLRVALVG